MRALTRLITAMALYLTARLLDPKDASLAVRVTRAAMWISFSRASWRVMSWRRASRLVEAAMRLVSCLGCTAAEAEAAWAAWLHGMVRNAAI